MIFIVFCRNWFNIYKCIAIIGNRTAQGGNGWFNIRCIICIAWFCFKNFFQCTVRDIWKWVVYFYVAEFIFFAFVHSEYNRIILTVWCKCPRNIFNIKINIAIVQIKLAQHLTIVLNTVFVKDIKLGHNPPPCVFARQYFATQCSVTEYLVPFKIYVGDIGRVTFAYFVNNIYTIVRQIYFLWIYLGTKEAFALVYGKYASHIGTDCWFIICGAFL